jgi:guanine deaminase
LTDDALLAEAIRLAVENVPSGGGPFGAVVAIDGQPLGYGANRVTQDHDPTAHAEIVALRAACAAAQSFSLVGATLYASCEPCPMCLAAAYWARIGRIAYAATSADAAAAGFDDARFYDELRGPAETRILVMHHDAPRRADAQVAFDRWREHTARLPY